LHKRNYEQIVVMSAETNTMWIRYKSHITFECISTFRWNKLRRNTSRAPSQVSSRTVRTETRFIVRMGEGSVIDKHSDGLHDW